jgi:hypothetical protein
MNKTLFFVLILIFSTLLFTTCNRSNNKKVLNSADSTRTHYKSIRKCWIDAKYLKLLKESYPKKYYWDYKEPVFFLDSFKHALIPCFNEFCMYIIQKNNAVYNFIVHDYNTDEDSTYVIKVLNADTLLLNNQIYISNENWDDKNDNEVSLIDKNFVIYIKGEIFKEKYRIQLQKLNISFDTCALSYAPDWKCNIISYGDDCKKTLIVEFKIDSIFIYKFLNICGIKKYQKIEKELLIKFHN